MSRLLFENSKAALGFAGVIIFGAAVFAGSDGAMGGYDRGNGNDRERRAKIVEAPISAARQRKSPPAEQQQQQPVFEDFAPDEQLIDDASGIDPTPEIGGEIISVQSRSDSSEGRVAPRAPTNRASVAEVSIPENAETADGEIVSVR
ncbi:MAG: hypothetical protein AAF941_07685 [Pseudomonadota bacterium]